MAGHRGRVPSSPAMTVARLLRLMQRALRLSEPEADGKAAPGRRVTA
jgi:hypothetical protein